MTDCIIGLTNDVGFDCESKPIGGIEQRVLLLNYLDIDRKQTRWNDTKTIITKLFLKEDKIGYLFTGIKKNFNGHIKIKGNGFEHGVNLTIYNSDDNSNNQINQIVKGGLYVGIVELKAKGVRQRNAFEVLGYNYGLEAVELHRNYNENDGIYKLQLVTPAKLIEQKTAYKWLYENYKETLNLFNAKLKGDDETNKIFDRTFDKTFE